MSLGGSKSPRLKYWFVIFITGAALGYFSLSPWPKEVFNIFSRGLVRHGWDIKFKFTDRRGLNLREGAGESPVTMSTGVGALLGELGEPVFRFFMTRDADKDGSLDPVEFFDFYRLLSPIQIPHKSKAASFDDSSNTLQIKTRFQPLLLNSTTKRLEEKKFTNSDYFKGLLQWTRPHRSKTKVSVKDFIDLLWPPAARQLTVGQSYDVLFAESTTTEHLRAYPSASNRYFLPSFNSRAEAVLSHLLSAFHPRAFPCTRYRPVGSAGVVRAVNAELVEVAFRIHSEFQLNDPPNYPFWYTPSYFFGHAIITRDLTKVLDFRLSTPSERALNVDMEWLQMNPGGNPMTTTVEVDIGYVPQMELKSAVSFEKAVEWTKEISMKKAFTAVERHLYPFKKIEYAPFPEAFARAQREGKPVHSVVLWGSLDDQSC